MSIRLNEVKKTVADISGAQAAGVTRCASVDDAALRLWKEWIGTSCHGDMKFLERYEDLRENPDRLLDGCRTVIMTAFSYANPDGVRVMEENGSPLISEYALGRDYHLELRERLKAAATALEQRYGGRTRVCVDTAPLRERYWAVRAGLGFVGVNNYLIIPGKGAHFYLGAILWTETVDEYDEPETRNCGRCGKCVEVCPTGALREDGRLDARKCLSYLTIESRQPLPANINSGRRLFGCDTCRRACPHEPSVPETTTIPSFVARQSVVNMTREDWMEITPEKFKQIFGDSAVSRAKLENIKSRLQQLR